MLCTDDRIGPYTLIRQLGQGSFGVVWLAEKRSAITTTEFALKLAIEGVSNLDALKKEAELWKRAGGHPNILPIIEADLYDGHVVIVSEYASDGSLEEWLERHQGVSPSIETAIEIVSEILAGLHHLHSRRIIHRDIKPANVLLQGMTPRLADFGIARVLQTTNLTTTIVGTPPYMAPEAFNGIRSEQTDIWSVGVVLYQLVSGRLPFIEQELVALITAIASLKPYPPPSSIPPVLKEIISRALDKNTDRRYKSADEMRRALHNIRISPTSDESNYATEVISTNSGNRHQAAQQPPLTDLSARNHERDPSQYVTQQAAVASFIPDGKRQAKQSKKSNTSSTRTHPNIHHRWLYLTSIIFLIIALIGIALSVYYYYSINQPGASISNIFGAKKGTVTGRENVNLRAGPSLQAEPLAVLPKGTRVQVYEDQGTWLRIRVLEWPSGSNLPGTSDEGWIDGRYIKLD